MALCPIIDGLCDVAIRVFLWGLFREPRFDLADLVGSRDRDPPSAYLSLTLTLLHQKTTLSYVQNSVVKLNYLIV